MNQRVVEIKQQSTLVFPRQSKDITRRQSFNNKNTGPTRSSLGTPSLSSLTRVETAPSLGGESGTPAKCLADCPAAAKAFAAVVITAFMNGNFSAVQLVIWIY